MSLNPKKVQFILQKNSSLTQQSEGLFSNSHFCTETTLDSCEIMRAASLLMTLSGSQIILDYNFAPAQQLLQIHHAFKCTHNSENCYFLHCTKMKQLCRHLYTPSRRLVFECRSTLRYSHARRILKKVGL